MEILAGNSPTTPVPAAYAALLTLAGWGVPAMARAQLPDEKSSSQAGQVAPDPRADYDVSGYKLELWVDPQQRLLRGSVEMRFRVCAAELRAVVLDAAPALSIDAAWLVPGSAQTDGSKPLPFARQAALLVLELPAPAAAKQELCVRIDYHASPTAKDEYTGFHWSQTELGQPWVASSCQEIGSSSWWPGKDSFFCPQDKPEYVEWSLYVPAGLTGVANGRLISHTTTPEGLEHFRWHHPYPILTYSMALVVGPFVKVERKLTLASQGDTAAQDLDFAYWVLPEDLPKAREQFELVPDMLRTYSAAFGPWPFPESKVSIVQTPFLGMEHSTVLGYGSTFPAWLKKQGLPDPMAARNRWVDYVLAHELAHEWWGNAVSVADWGDSWLHEGFATYAEGVLVESQHGREQADAFFVELARHVPRKGALYRGQGVDPARAYSSILYNKGALVLHTLRTFVDDDRAWWSTLRAFQQQFRYKNATGLDLRAVLERETGQEWKQFFDQWVLGDGYPCLSGRVQSAERSIEGNVVVTGTSGTQFSLPLDLAWTEGGHLRHERILLHPGENRWQSPCKEPPSKLHSPSLTRTLCRRADLVIGP